MPDQEPHLEITTASSTPLRFLALWIAFGLQSFGGGVATLALIRRTAVEREAWLSEEEFTRDWALVQIVPGINLLGLTVLLGRRVHGVMGIGLALFGLLLPSVIVTLLLTAGYAHIQHLPLVQAALRGVIPATVGLGLLTGWQMVYPALREAKQESRISLVVSLMALAGSVLAAWRLKVSPIWILVGAGALVTLGGRRYGRQAREERP